MTLEERLAEWEKQPGAVVSPAEKAFIRHMRLAADNGVGYGFMMQMIVWEWGAVDPERCLSLYIRRG
jgi:hypothetical protein